MKNPKPGERVKDKGGMGDEGVILNLRLDGGIRVKWLYQDGLEISDNVDPKTVKRVKPTTCEKCGRIL